MEQEGIYYYVRHTDGHNTRGADRFHEQARRRRPGTRSCSFISPEAGRAAGARAHQQLGLHPRDPAGRLRARRLRFRAAERRAEDAEDVDPRRTRRATTKSTTIRGYYIQKADGEQYAGVRIDEFGTQFEVAHAVDQREGRQRWLAVDARAFSARGSEPRASRSVGRATTCSSANTRRCPGGGGTEYRCSFTAMTSKQQFRPTRA